MSSEYSLRIETPFYQKNGKICVFTVEYFRKTPVEIIQLAKSISGNTSRRCAVTSLKSPNGDLEILIDKLKDIIPIKKR